MLGTAFPGPSFSHVKLFKNPSNAAFVYRLPRPQVSSILWAKNTKELVTGHGYSQNQLTVWKYPTMTRLAELTGHQVRNRYDH